MPYKVHGVDISQPEGRDTYLEVYSYFKELGGDLPDFLDIQYEALSGWVEENPEEAKEFFTYCSDHPDPEIRKAIAFSCDQLIKADPEFTIGMIEKLLSDENSEVRSVYDYYQDVLKDERVLDDFFKYSGILGVHRLIRAVKAARQTFEQPAEA